MKIYRMMTLCFFIGCIIFLNCQMGSAAENSPVFLPPVNIGSVNTDQLKESSGIVEGRTNLGIFYLHNDSGDAARFFAVNKQAKLVGIYYLQGAAVADVEDIAMGPGPAAGTDYIYLCDVGDNFEWRDGEYHTQPNGATKFWPEISIYRIPEPKIENISDLPQDPNDVPKVYLDNWQKIGIRYPDGHHNCEAVCVDPVSGDLFMIIKKMEKTAEVYVARAADLNAASGEDAAVDLTFVTTITARVNTTTSTAGIVGADILYDGSMIVVKNQEEVFMWPRAKGQGVGEVLAANPTAPYYLPVNIGNDPNHPGKGEVIGFAADGSGFYTHKEGLNIPIWFYALNKQALDAPGNLRVENSNEASLELVWDSLPCKTVKGYDIYNGNELLGKVEGTTKEPASSIPGAATILMPEMELGTSYKVTGLKKDGLYQFMVKARDLFDHVSEPGNKLVVQWDDSVMPQWLDSKNRLAPDPDSYSGISRAEFVALLFRSLGVTEDKSDNKFTDISPKAWYAGYIGAAVKSGSINGYDNGTFRPMDSITREQAAVIISRILKVSEKNKNITGKPNQALSELHDADLIQAWAKDSVARVLEAGKMTAAKDSSFEPQSVVSRQQALEIVRNLNK